MGHTLDTSEKVCYRERFGFWSNEAVMDDPEAKRAGLALFFIVRLLHCWLLFRSAIGLGQKSAVAVNFDF
jgi:hypothetical protein